MNAGADRGSRGLLACLALTGLALLGLLVALACLYVNVPAGWSPRIGPERDVTSLFPRLWTWSAWSLPSDSTAPVRFAARAKVILTASWIVYALAVAATVRLPSSQRRRALGIVTLVALLGHALMVLMPPVITGDLFRYALFGKMVSHYDLNPYVTSASSLREDPLWPYASWNFISSHYGPGFTWVSAATTWLSGGGVFWAAIGFKTLAALANLASCWLIRDVSVRLGEGDGLNAFALYALNPLVLFETAGMGHNEALVVAYALAGVSLTLRGRPWAGMVALLLSADVKYVTAGVSLFMAVHFIFRAADGRTRALRAAGVLGLGAAIAVALWAPFWKEAGGLATTWALVTRGPGVRTGDSRHVVSVLRLVLFAALIAGGAVAAARGSVSRALNLSAAANLAFLLGVYHWTLAWYAIPPLALAVAAPRSRVNTLLLLLSLGYGLLHMQYVTLSPA